MHNRTYADLSIVIPAFNEALAIRGVVEELQREMSSAEIIVVDDCSKDETANIIKGLSNVRLIRHAFNRGQGAALRTGMRHGNRKYIAWFDGDNEHKVDDLKRLYTEICNEKYAAVIGQRTTSSITWVRAVGKCFIRFIAALFGIKAVGSDLNCGLRVFKREVILQYSSLIPERFSASMVSTLILLGTRYPVCFFPVQTRPRIGDSSVRIKDGVDAILQLIRAILLFFPMRFFLPISAGFISLGTIYSVIMALYKKMGLPVAGILLIIVGVLIAILGIIADQISQIRLGGGDAVLKEMK
jgi:glycosyltransferase involved in cell wall biosynthesis